MRYPLLIFSALLLSCGGDGDLTAPDTGSLEIRASTSGEAGADYMVSIDGQTGRALAPNGSLILSDLESGFHTVEIVAPPPGCTVVGDNPRTVTVTAGSTNVVTFEVNCAPLLGSIQVTTTTTGSSPASYDLVMDGTSIGPVGSSATRIIENVPPGSHTISLGSVPATCQVEGTSSQAVTVEPSSSTPVTFSITCTPTQGGTGTLNITVGTSGPDADPDGYQAVVDGGAPQAIGINATLTLTSVAAGTHTVQLDGVPANCSVAGPNSQTVTVPANGSATVTFAVTCQPRPTTGTLRITTTTSGSDVDPDGYLVEVNDEEPVEMDADDELTLDLEPGSYTVTLSALAENCTVSDAEQTVEVTAGATEEIEFEVTCNAESGRLRVITRTIGEDPDDDGYVLRVNDEDVGAENNDEQIISDLAPGDYTVELGDVADNCEVAGENPRTVTVTAGETAETEFDVTCTAVEQPLGSIHVQITTTGERPDDDGYQLLLDLNDPDPVDATDEITIAGVNPGRHKLELSDVAPNCTVEDGATRTVEVEAEEMVEVSFVVNCP